MPLALGDVVFANLGLGGTATGLFHYQKPREGLPTADARLLLRGLTRSGLALTSRPIDLALVGRLTTTTLEARAVASEGGKTRGRLQAQVGMLAPRGELGERLRAAPLFAQLRYDGPADAIWRLMAIEHFDLTGPLAVAADIGGTLDEPAIRGSLAGSGLRLQSALTGTDVGQVTLKGRFTGSDLTLDTLTGRTAGNGQVTGSGSVRFAALSTNRGPSFDVRLGARNAMLLSRPDLALAATGPLRIMSDGTSGTIAGRLAIDSARWRLGQSQASAELPNIRTREINRGADVAPASVRAMPWRFLVDAAGPSRIRVSGLGIDSEWGADVHLRGTVDAPAIGGSSLLVQGTYEFAGKRFDLTRGRLQFDGSSPPDPRLDIAASAAINGLTATVTVGGTSLRPEINFSSIPAMPEEELLSRLLFGDSITQISAPEALQLGSALASLHGGGGLDPINRLRSAIGLDRLRIVNADPTLNRQTGVAAGKYLGRHVYAEIVTDGRGYSATNLEFRVTRWLSLLGTVSTVGRQAVNAKVSKDY
jgi:translocation and assembly module TamB